MWNEIKIASHDPSIQWVNPYCVFVLGHSRSTQYEDSLYRYGDQYKDPISMQERRNSNVLAMELRLSCIKPLILLV